VKVLIIGGAGYLGARLAQRLVARGDSVTVTVRALPSGSAEWARRVDEVLLGDVRSPDLHAQIAARRFDACVYTVSLDHHRSEDIDLAMDVSVRPMWKLVDVLARGGCRRLVYFSTQQVYGPFRGDGRYDEDAPPLPANAYGLTHALCEDVCEYYRRRGLLECASLRLSNAVGAAVFPTAHIDSLVAPDLCRMAVETQEMRLQSDGTPQRNFILLEDVSAAVDLLLRSPTDSLHATFNLGSPTTLTIGEMALEIAATCEALFGYRPEVLLRDGSRLGEGSALATQRFAYPIARLSTLGFAPSRSMRSGIEELLRQWRMRSAPA
jgi:UDP-glucose 4-epimerase